MTAYISAKFEKDTLAEGARIITRNIDQGPVPPSPSATYYPTHTDEYQAFIVAEYVDDTQGERFDKVATVSDLSGLTYTPMEIFNDTAAAFGSVLVGDILEITSAPAERWVSEEYPSSTFVATVVTWSGQDASNIKLDKELPAFQTGLIWNITRFGVPGTIATGIAGVTRREGITPGGGIQPFLEKRFNSFFLSAVEAENFVQATKAEMTALSNEVLGDTLVNEQFTAEPTI